MPRVPVPPAVLDAFGARGPARPLPGGQGTSWVAGDLVLKPADGASPELADIVAAVRCEGFRVATPVRALDGEWFAHGWSATRWVVGDDPDHRDVSTWETVVEAGRAFHRAVADVARPAFLDARDDWWAQADRVAWGEMSVPFLPELAGLVPRLEGALEDLGASQLVHGDLTHNVLVAPGLAPAVIDISPYWRPTAYAEGVVVADALCWYDAPGTLGDSLGVSTPAVARALLFRMATTNQRFFSAGGDTSVSDEARRYERAATALGL